MPRERSIPCRGASLQESIRGSHVTWSDDGYCDRCRKLAARATALARAAAEGVAQTPSALPDALLLPDASDSRERRLVDPPLPATSRGSL